VHRNTTHSDESANNKCPQTGNNHISTPNTNEIEMIIEKERL
jgi:hypothetical protein